MCVFTHASHAVLILLRTCTSAVSATHEKVHYELRLPSAFQLSPPLDRYTAVFTLGGGFCDVCFFFCFFFQGSVSWTEENTTRKKRLVSHTSHKQKEGGKKKKKGKNGKRVLIHKHLHFCKHKQASTTTPPPDKKQDFCHKHLPKYTERTNTQNTKYVQSNTCTPEHLSSLRVEVEVGCTCFSQGVLGFH